MRPLALPVLVLLFLAAGATLPARIAQTEEEAGVDEKPGIEDLAWLAGTWRGKVGDDVVEEIWGEPLGKGMVGVFRWLRGEEVYMYEILAVETTKDGGLAMRLRHFGAGLAPWESEGTPTPTWVLESLEDGKAVFEDPAHEFPRRLVYERPNGGKTLTARLEGTKGGKAAAMEFTFTRR